MEGEFDLTQPERISPWFTPREISSSLAHRGL